jgi:hypothetical protein
MACPSKLMDYPVPKSAPSLKVYMFTEDWKHASNVGSGVSQAYYIPDGWFSSWIAASIDSDDGRAVWHDAAIFMSCTKRVYYRSNGTIDRVQPLYTVMRTEGEVEEKPTDCGSTSGSGGLGCCGGGSGGGGGTGGSGSELMPVTSESYDPYDPSFSTSVDTGDCGSGDTGTGGTQYEPGDSTGGETVDWGTGVGNGGTSVCGSTAIVEYVCIDIWVDGRGWVEYSCGYATTC